MNLPPEFTCKEHSGGIYAITMPMKEQAYLVTGREKALLIDNGMGIGSLREYVETICPLPIIVINTHGHPDHAGGNIEFDFAYLHPSDNKLYKQMCTKEFRLWDMRRILGDGASAYEEHVLGFKDNVRPILDGCNIELGDRKIEALLVPGHTKGSIVLYDSQEKALFTGDTLGLLDTWLYLEYCTPLETYYKSLKLLQAKNLELKLVFSGHLPSDSPIDIIDRKIRCVEKILFYHETGIPCKTFAGEGLRFEVDGTSIVYNPDNLFESR